MAAHGSAEPADEVATGDNPAAYLYAEAPRCAAGRSSGREGIDYSYAHLDAMLERAVARGYEFRPLREVAAEAGRGRYLVMRHDVDVEPSRALELAEIEQRYGVRATYFFRCSANEYNVFGYRTLRVVDELRSAGHEVGLHTEPVDLAAARGTTPVDALRREIDVFSQAVGAFEGVATHNDSTPYNNLAFLRTSEAQEVLAAAGVYDAYGGSDGLYASGTYVTDSYRYFWRIFERGVLTDAHHCVCDLVERDVAPLYVLIHPELWYRTHFHHGEL